MTDGALEAARPGVSSRRSHHSCRVSDDKDPWCRELGTSARADRAASAKVKWELARCVLVAEPRPVAGVQ